MKKVMLFIMSAVFSVSASAASFDFAAIADLGEYGDSSISFTNYSTTVVATAPGAHAYLDAGNAGLGVCQNLATLGGVANQCDPGYDDNVEMDELLVLTFDEVATVTEFTFINGNHEDTFDGTFRLWVDNVLVIDNQLLASAFNGAWTGSKFEFLNTSANEDDLTKQFYVSSITTVPVPAAAFLFAPALLGFFGLRRKATLAA